MIHKTCGLTRRCRQRGMASRVPPSRATPLVPRAWAWIVRRQQHTMKTLLPLLVAFGIIGCTTYHSEMPNSWMKVHKGMSRQEVHALLGRPDSCDPEVQDVQKGELMLATDSWRVRGRTNEFWVLDVYYNTDGHVNGFGRGAWTTRK